MQNVELKVRVPSLAAIRDRLHQLEIPRAAELAQTDTYFANTRDGWRLKLREMPERSELIAYRRPDLASARLSEYTRTPLSDPDGVRVALRGALGVRVEVVKARGLYLYQRTRVHLDAVTGLGTFVELETRVDASEHHRAEQECAAVAAMLGIDGLSPVPNGYADLLESQTGVSTTDEGALRSR